MTTATLATGTQTMDDVVRPRRSLEELVDRLMDALFPAVTEAVAVEPSATRTIHEARRLRQAGDIDGALAIFAGMDMGKATPGEVRWAFSEWKSLVKRRCGVRAPAVYSQGAGRAAALVPTGHGGILEVVSALGMRWRPGKVVSARSLRGLRPPVSSTGQALGRACP